jgi:hypothetical protein
VSFPIELSCHIVNFIQPTIVTSTERKSCARQLVNISLVNKEFNEICSEKLVVLKKINDFVNKYNRYNSYYENSTLNLKDRNFDPKANPQLLDALSTGHPFAASTFRTYNPEIEQDIKDIVKLTPQSMNCTLGTLRCRTHVPPLAIACYNVNIPLHIVEFLLKQGADRNATLKFNGYPVSIFTDLKFIINERFTVERFAAIKTIFFKDVSQATIGTLGLNS